MTFHELWQRTLSAFIGISFGLVAGYALFATLTGNEPTLTPPPIPAWFPGYHCWQEYNAAMPTHFEQICQANNR